MKNKTQITFDNFEPNAIELLGFAKNNIVEAKEKENKLPIRYKNKLSSIRTRGFERSVFASSSRKPSGG